MNIMEDNMWIGLIFYYDSVGWAMTPSYKQVTIRTYSYTKIIHLIVK